MGIINKTPEREEFLNFSDIPQGTEYCTLFVLPENKEYNFQDFKSFDGITVGAEEGTYQISLLEDFARVNNFDYFVKIYPTLMEASEALSNKEIDALLASNTDSIPSYKMVAQFSSDLFYFVVHKNNTQLIGELNKAMNDLFTYNPNFSNDLYSRYYGFTSSDEFGFTREEILFINQNPEINIICDVNWPPIEYYSKKEGKFDGITPEIIDLINSNSGLNIKGVDYINSVEVLKEFQSGNLENSLTVMGYDFNWAKRNKVKITQPFMTTSIVNVSRDRNNTPRKAAVVELDFITEKIKKHYPHLELKAYDDVKQCMDAVINGEVDCTYINGIQSEYYMSIIDYKKLSYHTVDTFVQPLCIGVSENSSPYLFSIISKSLATIPKEKINTILFHNSNKEIDNNLLYYVQMNPVKSIVIIMSFFVFLIIIGFTITKERMDSKNIILLEYNRYNELMGMVGEIIFEYNYDEDMIVFKNLPDYMEEKQIIHSYSNWSRNILENNDVSIDNCIFTHIKKGEDNKVELHLLGKDGVKRWFETDIKVIKDKNGNNKYAIGKMKNIDTEKTEKEKLIEKASIDSMTKILNHRSFERSTNQILKSKGTLLVIDIDNFKNINDSYGHDIGDKVLISFAHILKTVCRKKDIVGRIGGDEFAVFLNGYINKAGVEKFCKKMNQVVKTISPVKSMKGITISIGAAIDTTGKQEYKDMYKEADIQLYKTKKKGKDSYTVCVISDKFDIPH